MIFFSYLSVTFFSINTVNSLKARRVSSHVRDRHAAESFSQSVADFFFFFHVFSWQQPNVVQLVITCVSHARCKNKTPAEVMAARDEAASETSPHNFHHVIGCNFALA